MPRPTRRTGRPPLVAGESSQPVTVRVSATAYERLCERASRERCTVPAALRDALNRWLVDEDEPDD